jgi:hypothetical protein
MKLFPGIGIIHLGLALFFTILRNFRCAVGKKSKEDEAYNCPTNQYRFLCKIRANRKQDRQDQCDRGR